jgi:hypothetical protein
VRRLVRQLGLQQQSLWRVFARVFGGAKLSGGNVRECGLFFWRRRFGWRKQRGRGELRGRSGNGRRYDIGGECTRDGGAL